MSDNIISPFKEMLAYESLWSNEQKMSFKAMAESVRGFDSQSLYEIYNTIIDKSISEKLIKIIKTSPVKINAIINKTIDYPSRLRDAKDPLELIYYSGDMSLLYTRSIAVVGSRKPTRDGIRRAEKMTKFLVGDGFTIASGLADGIDTVAHRTSIANKGRTIAVIGTPLNTFYPKTNRDLQMKIARDHLLISQVPFIRYSLQGPNVNRFFFPERNKTMSAISEATIIIEASDTSGTLIQARAALAQRRKLFILQSCFENKSIKWPERFEKMGAIRVRDYSDVINNL